MDNKNSNTVVDFLESFISELKECKTTANLLVINNEHFKLLKKSFPYLIKDRFFLYKKEKIRIITTEDDIIGAGFCLYYTNVDKSIKEYN